MYIILALLCGLVGGYLFRHLTESEQPVVEGGSPVHPVDAPVAAGQNRPGGYDPQTSACVVDEQMIQAHKLAAFGQLSTGVAHEINNPLAIINEEAGWLDDLLAKDESKDFKYRGEFKESLRIIVQQTHRCGSITGKLLRFAENMDSNIGEVDLNDILDEVVGIMEKDAILNNIVIERDFDPELPKMYSDSAQLRQLALNLVNNALDAVERDGKVLVGTRREGTDWVLLTVKDDGCGIPREHHHSIFEPFFTTKPPGKGAGLGLSICYGIATKLGGVISVDSAPAKGATFTVTLPMASSADTLPTK